MLTTQLRLGMSRSVLVTHPPILPLAQTGTMHGSPQDSNWFDLFSTPAPHPGGGTNSASGLSLPPPVPPLNSSSRFGGMSPSMGRKRLRDEGGGSDGAESDEQQLRRERAASVSVSVNGDRKS